MPDIVARPPVFDFQFGRQEPPMFDLGRQEGTRVLELEMQLAGLQVELADMPEQLATSIADCESRDRLLAEYEAKIEGMEAASAGADKESAQRIQMLEDRARHNKEDSDKVKAALECSLGEVKLSLLSAENKVRGVVAEQKFSDEVSERKDAEIEELQDELDSQIDDIQKVEGAKEAAEERFDLLESEHEGCKTLIEALQLGMAAKDGEIEDLNQTIKANDTATISLQSELAIYAAQVDQLQKDRETNDNKLHKKCQATIDELNQTIETNATSTKVLESDCARYSDQLGQFQKDKEAIDNQLRDLTRSIDNKNYEISQLEQKVKTEKAKTSDIEDRLEKMREELATARTSKDYNKQMMEESTAQLDEALKHVAEMQNTKNFVLAENREMHSSVGHLKLVVRDYDACRSDRDAALTECDALKAKIEEMQQDTRDVSRTTDASDGSDTKTPDASKPTYNLSDELGDIDEDLKTPVSPNLSVYKGIVTQLPSPVDTASSQAGSPVEVQVQRPFSLVAVHNPFVCTANAWKSLWSLLIWWIGFQVVKLLDSVGLRICYFDNETKPQSTTNFALNGETDKLTESNGKSAIEPVVEDLVDPGQDTFDPLWPNLSYLLFQVAVVLLCILAATAYLKSTSTRHMWEAANEQTRQAVIRWRSHIQHPKAQSPSLSWLRSIQFALERSITHDRSLPG
jgi:hypothetical protein